MALDVFKNASSGAGNDDAMFATFVKLLAEENITTITSPTFKTAFFDLKRRIVGIPAWKNMSRNLKMALRFHECGHALFSEVESFHDFIEGKYGRALSGIINVCEDDRNDRLTQKKFPGSKQYYKEGYKEIMARFWKDGDYENASFADKLNLDSKVKDQFPLVPANETEAKLYFRFKNTQTVEEVIALAYDIYAYCKEEAKTDTSKQPSQEEQELEQDQDQDQGEGMSFGESDQEEKSENEGTGGEQGETEQKEESTETEGEGDESGEKSEGEKTEDGKETDSKPDDKNDFEGEANSDNTNFTQTNDQFKEAEQDIVNENDESNQQLPRDYFGRPINPVDQIIILKSTKKNFVGYKEFNKKLQKQIEDCRTSAVCTINV